MRVLKQLDLSQEKKLYAEMVEMNAALKTKARELNALLEAKTAEYYGSKGWVGFTKVNNRTYDTEDGYTVTINDSHITITKPVNGGTVHGLNTIIDKGEYDYGLQFSMILDKGGHVKLPDKYAAVCERMTAICNDETVYDPFVGFTGLVSFVFGVCENIHQRGRFPKQ
jgi:hypothetical protein